MTFDIIHPFICNMPETIVSYEKLQSFTQSLFKKLHVQDAALAAKALLAADLRGVDSHGVARLSGYIRLIEAGRINPAAIPKIIHQTPSTATIDGDKGLGLTVAPFAMQTAIEKAKAAGTGWVSVKNSNHFGIAAVHAMLALEHDMIGIAMTNASALGRPHLFYRTHVGYQSHLRSHPGRCTAAICGRYGHDHGCQR